MISRDWAGRHPRRQWVPVRRHRNWTRPKHEPGSQPALAALACPVRRGLAGPAPPPSVRQLSSRRQPGPSRLAACVSPLSVLCCAVLCCAALCCAVRCRAVTSARMCVRAISTHGGRRWLRISVPVSLALLLSRDLSSPDARGGRGRRRCAVCRALATPVLSLVRLCLRTRPGLLLLHPSRTTAAPVAHPTQLRLYFPPRNLALTDTPPNCFFSFVGQNGQRGYRLSTPLPQIPFSAYNKPDALAEVSPATRVLPDPSDLPPPKK